MRTDKQTNKPLRELSLFTGAGGLLGTKLLGWQTVGYVEWEAYCQQVIAQRIADGCLDAAPVFGDIRAFLSDGYAASYTGLVDVITAGFPCQPFSVAGKQRGEADDRNMWPDTAAVIRTVRPRFVLLENVPGLLSHRYFGTVLGDLASAGYDCRWRCLSAADCGAPHRRERLWITGSLANSTCRKSG
jgi:DNA (cytosine-5)-methyltransferase 1